MKLKKLLVKTICLSLLVISVSVTSEKDRDKEKPLFTPDEMQMLKKGGAGSDLGMKVGLVTVVYIGKGLVSAGASIKAGVIGAATAVKDAAVAVATARVAPYVAGGAAAVGVV